MFGALNRFIARLDGEPQEQNAGIGGACGFQVLRNSNTELPLEPWFDFIIGINGRTLVSLKLRLSDLLLNGASRTAQIRICSVLRSEMRQARPSA
jgi:hypothetical protein